MSLKKSIATSPGEPTKHKDFNASETTSREQEEVENNSKRAANEYKSLRLQGYGTWQDQFEIMQEQGFDAWVAHCQSVKIKFPKPE